MPATAPPAIEMLDTPLPHRAVDELPHFDDGDGGTINERGVEETMIDAPHAMHLIALAAQPQFWLQRLRRPNLSHRLLTQALIPVLAVPPQKARLRGAFPRHGSVPL